jgi:RimJ/RimL family protein N-acetyltransferase
MMADKRVSDITLREANLSDMEALLLWRNDAFTRAMSIDTRELDLPSHQQWFTQALNNERFYILIAQLGESGERLGMVRFDLEPNLSKAKISINLSAQSRGKGYASRCLTEAIELFKKRYRQCDAILAQIKTNNIGSIRSFEQVGFCLDATQDNQDEQSDKLLSYYLNLGNEYE